MVSPVAPASIHRNVPTVESVLHAHASVLGNDFHGYRNHTYRVFNLCVAIQPGDGESLERIAVATAFHDLGIWTDGTFDYLAPSVQLARAYVTAIGRGAWVDDVTQMILQHHKLFPSRGAAGPLVEAFRRADWIDVSRGALRFGVPRSFVRELYSAWPGSGFHRRLVQLSWQRLRTHPLSPLPMVRW